MPVLRSRRPDRPSIVATFLAPTLALGLVACAPVPGAATAPPAPTQVPAPVATGASTPSAPLIPLDPAGSPLPTPLREIAWSRPPASTCDRIIRGDTETAAAFRRQSMGVELRSDPTYLEPVAGDPAADVTAWGVPLLPEEVRAIDDAGIARDDQSAILTLVAFNPDHFGSIWIDRGPWPGDLFVAVVHADPTWAARAACVAPARDRVRLVRIDVSMTELSAVQDRIGAAMVRRDELTATVVSVAADGIHGRVIVGATGATPEVVRQLRAEYGPLVVVEEQQPATY